ncbi:MAG: hypothetical protein IKE22_04850, partial [Atopobiaceae bacterium]|nr:hypothetical protein [Atopobiaceae bacterium]
NTQSNEGGDAAREQSGSAAETTNDATTVDSTQSETTAVAAPERNLPIGEYQETGEGALYLINQSGTTQNGDEIVVYPNIDRMPYGSIGYELRDLDGSILTYIYLDGVQMEKQQIGIGFQGNFNLMEDWQVTPGEHIVEAVQYANNDPSGEIIFYRSEKYIVKEA